jgi:hypothetical protein
MVIQLTDKDGKQVRQLKNVEIDMALNDDTQDFEITIPSNEHDKRFEYGSRIFVADTEIGGILGEQEINTAVDSLCWRGLTWRGLLNSKVISPESGQDYYVVTGELNEVLRELIEPRFSGLFRVPEIDSRISVHHQFSRYCTLLEGITDMLRVADCKPEIRYREGEPNESGYVEVRAVPIVDYSNEIELSQDSKLNFKMNEKKNGVNHLIVLGKGELKDRTVIHLYVQQNGTVGELQFYTGIDEIEQVYEASAEDSELLIEGEKKLRELMNRNTFEMDVEALGLDVSIGDIVGGRDQITGMYMAKPVESIIVKIQNGEIRKDYKLEG